MTRDQFVVAFVVGGFWLWAGLPLLVRRLREWWAPEPLAPFSEYQDVDL